jgi:hemerythrin-like domain-containing protein
MTTRIVPALNLPGQAASHSGPLNLNVNYLVHYAFRRDFARLLNCVPEVEPGDVDRATALSKHFTAMMAVLHEHHSGEDDFIWPVVEKENPELADLLEEMEAEHAGLAPAVWAALQAFDAFSAEATAENAAATEDALVDVVEVLIHHLDHEESAAVPALQEHVDPAVWRGIEKNLQRSGDVKLLRFFVPWLLDGLSEEDLKAVKGTAPRPLLLFWTLRWKKEYARYAEDLWAGCGQ